MITFKEGEITLLYVPFDITLSDDQQKTIENVLFENQWAAPQWDKYNTMFEGYILEDNTEESDCPQMMNDDDHMEAYFEIRHMYDDINQRLKEEIGLDIMVCTGSTGFCDLELAC